MTHVEPVPPLFPDELVAAAGERPVLETFLDLYRDAVVRKVTGVSDEDARRRLVPSLTTLGGLLRHLRYVETEWFGQVLAGHDADQPPGPDGDFQVGPADTVATLVADYERACAASREVAATMGLDDTVAHERLGRVSLRWVYVHLVEETARHAGHADILRELLDGSTGL